MDVIQPILAVALVLSLLGATVHFLRGRNAGVRLIPPGLISRTLHPDSNRIRQSGTLRLTSHHSLHLVHFGGKDLLLGAHPGGLFVIGRGRAGEFELDGRTVAEEPPVS